MSGTGDLGDAGTHGQEWREDTPAIVWNPEDERPLVVYRWGKTSHDFDHTTIRVTHTFGGYEAGADITSEDTHTSPDVAYKPDPDPDEHEALAYFSDRHREFSEQLGPPHKDPDEPRIAEIADATGVPVRRFATWVLGERVVSLMLSPEDEKQWQVLISGP